MLFMVLAALAYLAYLLVKIKFINKHKLVRFDGPITRGGAETGKISEHAHGNAIDIAGFTFKSGKTFTIAPREEDSTLNGAFQRSIASAACLYFSTVLDPGSDKAHETHLHLDTMKRKGGYRYCW